MADNIPYPGNPNLPREARDKIVSTFRHSLSLFRTGRRDECAVGCDFILKMDPRFTPARQLLEMARNPSAPADLAALDKYAQESAPAAPATAAAPPRGGAAPDKLLIEAIEAYAARDFPRAIENANRVLAAVPGNADAQEILAKAKKKLDLQPHVENFRQRALFALESGQMEEARLNFERMKNLDPEHPAVEALAQRLAGAPAARPAAPPPAPPRPPAAPASGAAPGAGARPAAAPAPPPPPNFFSPAPKEELDIAFDVAAAPTTPPVAPFAPGGPAQTPAVPPPPAFFDAPAPAAPAPPPAPDLWSTPAPSPAPPGAGGPAAPSVSPEVGRLLREGDDLEARGNPQGAIEAWSRIFLIDLNNTEAAGRIERTRARLADANRRVSEALRGGRSLYEGGKLKEAREKFLEVLAIDENEPTARSYLNRIEEDLSRPQPSYDLSQQAGASDILAEEELPAEPSVAPRGPRERAERAEAPSGRKSLPLLIASGVLLVAILAGVFVLLRSRSHAPSPPVAAETDSRASIAEAQRLFKEGRVDEARGILEKIPSGDPQYVRAQKLLSTFGPATTTATSSAGPVSGSEAPAPADAASLRAQAEASLAQHRYIDALKAFNQSAPAYPTDDVFKQEMNQAAQKVQDISPAVKLYNDGDFEAAIPILWRLNQADHDNLDVRSYLVRCYYNQGVVALQNNLFDKASQTFQEALGVEPGDELSQRQKSFADRYKKRSPDLLARIYVKYLRPRP